MRLVLRQRVVVRFGQDVSEESEMLRVVNGVQKFCVVGLAESAILPFARELVENGLALEPRALHCHLTHYQYPGAGRPHAWTDL